MTPVIPELRAALLDAAQAQRAAETAASQDVRPTVLGPEVSHGARARHGARGRRRNPGQRLRGWIRRGGAPLIVALVVGTGGLATAAGLVVSQATKDRATQLTRSAAPEPGTGFSTLGAQMVQTAKEVRAELPYPPGMTDTYDWSKYSAGTTLGTGGETRREIQLMSEYRAGCIWRRYYLKVHDAGDRRGMADAAKILAQVPDWPATRGLPGRRGRPVPATGPDAEFARRAARGEVTEAMRTAVLINCTDGVDPRLRRGETQREALERIKREARAAGG